MSTAHRPTWKPKSGGGGLRDGVTAPPTLQHSSKDQQAHCRLKTLAPSGPSPDQTHLEHDAFFADALGSLAAVDAAREHAITLGDVSNDSNGGSDDGSDTAGGAPSESDDGEELDEDSLLQELEKIRQERLAAKQSSAIGKQSEAFVVKRRWEEEGVIFRRPVAPAGSGADKKRFINDTVRSDYHKYFMEKYVR